MDPIFDSLNKRIKKCNALIIKCLEEQSVNKEFNYIIESQLEEIEET
ncbi:unnamed protein product, partial [Brachionus calyciflorus]